MAQMVIVTARDSDHAWKGRLRVRSALMRSGTVVALQPFGMDDITVVATDTMGSAPPPDLVRTIAERRGESRFSSPSWRGCSPTAARTRRPSAERCRTRCA